MSILLTKKPKPLPGEYISKGFWAGRNYYKTSHFTFVSPCDIIINDEILQNMYYYYLNLIDIYNIRENSKILKEIVEVEEFLTKYQKKNINQ